MPSSAGRLPTTVPADLTSFVGRRQDVAAVRQLVSTARLVTLTGIGGVGKTRLAFRVAGELRRALADGVCLVELASLDNAALLPHTVMEALVVREQSARDPIEVLCDHLRTRRMLLVLDNCEHLVTAVADLVARVMRAAPDIKILATSRQALRVEGEYVYLVSPLPVPNPDAFIRAGTATQYPAVALLAERSEAVVPGFALSPDNESAVIRLCHKLEGIPLAIELAAVRLRLMSVEELVSRLDDRFGLLREGSRNLPERHQTLQALIDWSYDLCNPNEQALWSRASVFAGGFNIDALEAVCADDALPQDAILDTVSGLLDKSILTRDVHGDQVRFRMLDTIRAYGQARLEAAGAQAELDRRHRDWCLRLLETAGAEWVGPRQLKWSRLLLLETANLRRALEYCVTQPGNERIAMRLAAAPWFWGSVGTLAEGRLWLDRALALDAQPSLERVWALATAAYLAGFQGDEETLATCSSEARSMAVDLEHPDALAYTTHVLGVWQLMSPEPNGAVPLLREALEMYSQTSLPHHYPDSASVELAGAYILAGDIDNASVFVDKAYDACSANGDRWNLSYALWGRGFVRLRRGDLEGAEADLREALIIKRPFHDVLGLAFVLEVLAWTTVAKGEYERAAILFGATDMVWQGAGAHSKGQLPREEFDSAARRTLGEAKFQAAFARGTALTLDETLALALQEQVRAAPEAPAAPSPLELTPRQREVAELVASGLSNKEIATKLVISLRTAEGHVESILTKLDFTTRTQIANWVMRQSAREPASR